MRILYDVKLLRPGCVLLQAAAGCDHGVAHHFPTASWLTFPTDDLRVYEVTDVELRKLSAMTRRRLEEKSAKPGAGED